MNKIKRIALVGGTHGNEFTGVYLIKKFERCPELIKRPSFETLTLLGNPQAVTLIKRYIDKDLNRCFLSSDLQDLTLTSYEDNRAKVINQILGPKGKSQVDVIVDLHSTTANMGLSILLGNQHPVLLQLAAYLSAINPAVKVCLSLPKYDSSLLRSLSELGFAIEVGSVAQGVLNADLFFETESLIYAVLDYFDKCNQDSLRSVLFDENQPQLDKTLTVYKTEGVVDYPRNEAGEITAMIHPQLQFQDYKPLHPGEPMFLTFDGKTIPYTGKSIVYPIFINEAAYYEKGIALTLTSQQQLAVN